MAASEGTKRIKTLGTRIAVFGGGAGLLLCIAVFSRVGVVQPLDVAIAVGFPVCLGIAIRVFGWLLEGFLAGNDS
jgi:hypothetical protein